MSPSRTVPMIILLVYHSDLSPTSPMDIFPILLPKSKTARRRLRVLGPLFLGLRSHMHEPIHLLATFVAGLRGRCGPRLWLSHFLRGRNTRCEIALFCRNNDQSSGMMVSILSPKLVATLLRPKSIVRSEIQT